METIKLIKLSVSNYKAIEALAIDVSGKDLWITGPNASGKTSAIEALWVTLKGFSRTAIPDPVRHGEDKATITATLSNGMKVTRVITQSSTNLRVESADGTPYKSPQAILDQLLGEYSLDPLAFINRRAQDQVDDILRLAGITPPVDEVERITGERLDVTAGETCEDYLMRLSADTTGLFYDRRRNAYRIMADKSAAADELEEELRVEGGPPGEDEGPVHTHKIIEEISQLHERNTERREAKAEVDRLAERMEDARQKSLEKQRRAVEIENLLAKAQQERDDAQADWEASVSAFDAISEGYKQMPVATDRIAAKKVELENAQATNEQLAKRKRVAEMAARLVAEAKAAETDHGHLDAILNQLRALRMTILEDIDIGVDKLSVREGQLYLADTPLKGAASSEKLRVACMVAMKQKPDLRLLRVDDCEQLDSDQRAVLHGIAAKNGFQVISASVTDSDRMECVIVDG